MVASPFVPTFLSEPFPDGYDPVIFPGEHFADGQHRVLFLVAGSHYELHKTADFSTFTSIDDDWMPSVGTSGQSNFQDSIVLPDGTFVLYQNDDDQASTAVWTGQAADIDDSTITRRGQVLPADGDCGVFHDTRAGLVHIYTEDDADRTSTASSRRLRHFTTPDDDLLNPTFHGDVIVTDGSWGTGDPDIIEMFGCYWMFTDYSEAHPIYWIALYRSDDLYTWEAVDKTFTAQDGTRAGDFEVIDMGDHLIALSEYTGGNSGIGVWRLDKRPSAAFAPTRLRVGGTTHQLSVGGSPATARSWPL